MENQKICKYQDMGLLVSNLVSRKKRILKQKLYSIYLKKSPSDLEEVY